MDVRVEGKLVRGSLHVSTDPCAIELTLRSRQTPSRELAVHHASCVIPEPLYAHRRELIELVAEGRLVREGQRVQLEARALLAKQPWPRAYDLRSPDGGPK